jgi:hypothetical protein
VTRGNVYGAAYLEQAAEMAVALAAGQQPQRKPVTMSLDMQCRMREAVQAVAPTQRYVRGIFSGGTFCFEVQLIHAAAGIPAFSNAPVAGNRKIEDVNRSVEHTIIDLGDDEFTRGRPHPMIDPTLRDARIREEAADPSTAVVLFDVVIGYGASAEPVAGLLSAIGESKAKAQAEGRHVVFIGAVCGTDDDPQNRSAVVNALTSAGVVVASSNAEAATWSAVVISEIKGASK